MAYSFTFVHKKRLQNLFFILILSFVTLSSYAQNIKKSSELKKHLKFADESINLGQYQVAIDVLHEIESEGAQFDEWNFLVGYAYLHAPYLNKSKSLFYFNEIKDLDSYYELDFYLARSLQYNHKFLEAYNLFEKFLKDNEGIDKKTYDLIQGYMKECQVALSLMKDSLDLLIVNLGPNVNSKYAEVAPVLSADEYTMVLTSRRKNTPNAEIDELSGLYYEDVFISERDDLGEWKKVKPISSNINTTHHDAAVGMSPDGNTIFLYHSDGKSSRNGESGGDIYESKRNGKYWSKPTPLKGDINSDFSETHASLTADGKTLYFTSSRNDREALGGQDIYVSHKQSDGSWGKAKNLGSNINTSFDEEGPYVHPNGNVLYFSSKGHNGIGGYDIFYSEWDDESKSWGKAKNIGYPINTADHDVFYVISADGERSYFSSIREDSYGGQDIYMATIPAKSINLIALNGDIKDADSDQSLEGRVKVINNETGEIVEDIIAKNGEFLLYLDPNINYGVRYMLDGYLFHSDNINIPNQTDYIEVSNTIKLHKIGDQKREQLNNVFLKNNDLLIASDYELRDLTNFIKNLDEYSIDINVHKAKYVNEDSVAVLVKSQKEAELILSKLINYGVSTDKVSAVGYGWKYPIASNQTQLGRLKNERIEYVVRTPEEIVVFEEVIEVEEEPLPEITPHLGEVMDIVGTINFAFGSNHITPESYRVIAQVFDVMYRYPNLIVEVGGHTDNKGSALFNYKLGEKRARIVVQELVRLGIEPERLQYKSYGFDSPIDSNSTEEGRKNNRRISFTPIEFK